MPTQFYSLHLSSNGGIFSAENSKNDFELVDPKVEASLAPAAAIVPFSSTQFDIVPLQSLPQLTDGERVPITLLGANDPDNIYFRLSSWVSCSQFSSI